eukprot:TRINITY_DN5942_c0_g1_i1.p1 TRINITY_DN5942_c0_g1~~TRINITY_DN5942_c0_g1_i1.p1  ORF type:complete len:320 (-),score=48.34 TRINITY_DN5942_c0_g1_i1:44-1003(-)
MDLRWTRKEKKMSKSLGNVVSPSDIIYGSKKGSKRFKIPYGVDVLRYWVAAHGSLSSSILVTEGAFADSKTEVDKIRNALKFCLGNLSNETNTGDNSPQTLLDKYIHSKLYLLKKEIEELYENLDLGRICRLWSHFISNELSGLYFLGAKDRLYCHPVDSPGRISAAGSLSVILKSLVHWTEPILPLLKAELSQHVSLPPKETNPFPSTHYPESVAQVEALLPIRDEVLRLMKNGKWTLIIDSLNASITPEDLREILRADQVSLWKGEELENKVVYGEYVSEDWKLRVIPGCSLNPCPRCRLHRSTKEDSLCDRCEALV